MQRPIAAVGNRAIGSALRETRLIEEAAAALTAVNFPEILRFDDRSRILTTVFDDRHGGKSALCFDNGMNDRGENDSETVLGRTTVREVAGVFHSREAIDAAVGDLLRSGFDRADIDLMASVDAVRQKLSGDYVPAKELADVPRAPRDAFLARTEIASPLVTAAGVLTFVGASAAALAVVASGGALALAATAAALAGGVVGSASYLRLAQFLGQKEAKDLETRMAAGGLVLWVRVRSPDREETAQQILSAHGAEAIRVHEIEIEKRLEDLPLHSLRPDPWLGDEPLATA
jgi:hypothetical protein